MKSTLPTFTTLLLAICVSAEWGPSILLAPLCEPNNANDVLAKADPGASCQDDSVPLIIRKTGMHAEAHLHPSIFLFQND